MRRILFTSSGNPHRGSWIIRGLQLGEAIGERAVLEASDAEIAAADLVVVVKRASHDLLARIRRRGVPWVFDILDCWPQPTGNAWTGAQAIQWLRGHIRQTAPTGLICATKAMSKDVADDRPALTLYHHARPGQDVNPIRKDVHAIGYEGSERYLDGWRSSIEGECRERGWSFFVNPPSLASVDIVLAVRGGQWDGWTARRWKSNVKLANAQGSGTPIICAAEHGYVETASGGESFVASPNDLGRTFDDLTAHETRATRAEMMRRAAPHVEEIALGYRRWLESIQ